MPIYFIASRQGSGRATRADGYLIADNKIFVARSGRLLADTDPAKIRNGQTTERGEIPPGTYRIGEAMPLYGGNKLTMTDGKQDISRFQKFAIEPTASNRQRMSDGTWGVRDARYPTAPRSLLRFHYDGDRPGSEGCIAYDDLKAQDALIQAQKTDPELRVEYLDDQTLVRARVKAITGNDPP